jgi:hypothetical protein
LSKKRWGQGAEEPGQSDPFQDMEMEMEMEMEMKGRLSRS